MTCLFGKSSIGLLGYNLMRYNPQHRSYSSIRNIYIYILFLDDIVNCWAQDVALPLFEGLVLTQSLHQLNIAWKNIAWIDRYWK